MNKRQYCTPHLFGNGIATAMEQIPFQHDGYDESFFQKLLLENPSILPVDEIESIYAPLIPLGREIPTAAGPVDVLYISPDGYLTLVETKLWRRPEARRQVVAQIIDYATAMSRWSYEQLREAVNKKGAIGDDPVLAALEKHHEQLSSDFDQSRFLDTVSRNLTKGRFLLLIVGDGIHESVEHLADTLSRSPQLGFTLALVELSLFRSSNNSEQIFIQPRLLARTREMLRAVVEIREPSKAADLVISLPKTVENGGGKRLKITVNVFLEKLADSTTRETADDFRDFLEAVGELRIQAEGRDASVSLRWTEPNSEKSLSFGSVLWDGGTVSLAFVAHHYRKRGLNSDIGMRYVNGIAELIPGAKVREGIKDGKAWPRVVLDQREVTLTDLLPKAREWVDLLRLTLKETEADAEARLETRP